MKNRDVAPSLLAISGGMGLLFVALSTKGSFNAANITLLVIFGLMSIASVGWILLRHSEKRTLFLMIGLITLLFLSLLFI